MKGKGRKRDEITGWGFHTRQRSGDERGSGGEKRIRRSDSHTRKGGTGMGMEGRVEGEGKERREQTREGVRGDSKLGKGCNIKVEVEGEA